MNNTARWAWTLGWMMGCQAEVPTSTTPSSPPQPTTTAPEPAPAPAPTADAATARSTEPFSVALSPPTAAGGMMSTGSSHAEVAAHPEGLIDHPQPEPGMQFMVEWYGERRLAIGFASADGTWTASADLDADGVLSAHESVVLSPAEDGEPTGHLAGSVVRNGTPVPVPIRLTTRVMGGQQAFGVQLDARRDGALPDGTLISVFSHGGGYDVPRAHVVVDENGDGEVDIENWLVSFAVAEGIVEAHGQRWRFTPSPDGSTLSLEPTDEAAPGLRAGRPAPPFSVVASDGATHDLARYRGSMLLLDFWATWCAPCIALHPEVEALAAEYQLAVLGISADDDQTHLNRWLQRHPTPWPSAAIGPAGSVNQAYGVTAWPSHALIDGDGRLLVLGSFASVQRAMKTSR